MRNFLWKPFVWFCYKMTLFWATIPKEVKLILEIKAEHHLQEMSGILRPFLIKMSKSTPFLSSAYSSCSFFLTSTTLQLWKKLDIWLFPNGTIFFILTLFHVFVSIFSIYLKVEIGKYRHPYIFVKIFQYFLLPLPFATCLDISDHNVRLVWISHPLYCSFPFFSSYFSSKKEIRHCRSEGFTLWMIILYKYFTKFDIACYI